jgi:hypothetical protein
MKCLGPVRGRKCDNDGQDWEALDRDRPILLGKFGAYDKGDMESRVR